MNILNIIQEGLTNIQKEQGDDIFDLDEIYKQYVEFYMSLYSIINKHKTARLRYMTPKQYIYTIARGFVERLSYEDAISPTNKEIIDKYANDMLNGLEMGLHKNVIMI